MALDLLFFVDALVYWGNGESLDVAIEELEKGGKRRCRKMLMQKRRMEGECCCC